MIFIRHRNITESMISLEYKTEETIDRLEMCFHMSYLWRQKISSEFQIIGGLKGLITFNLLSFIHNHFYLL